jgi:RnfABCDGE-type electron transport complex B subunit
MFEVIAQLEISSVGMAGFLLLGIGLFFVIILTVAHARLKVEQDPIVEAISEVLPGANCGGCGLAGCSAYAEAVVKDHGLMGKCGPGGEELVREIAAILGIEAAASAPVRAVVHCAAKTEDRIDSTKYQGVQTCGEAQMIASVQGCPYGCMGFGDCAQACEFDAIHVVDGLATVDYNKCVGCGACMKACPRQLIELLPMQEDPMLLIACASLDKVKDVRGYCKVGCAGCGLCAKMVPNTFQMKQNLAVLDYEKYPPREELDKAVEKCPRAMMIYVGKNTHTEPVEASVEETTPTSS